MVHLLLAVIYMSFISLGLPDALLGASWPMMYLEFDVPISYAGVVTFIISVGTVISSLMSDRLTRKFGAGKVTACSVGMTALALFGFSVSGSFWMLLIWAIPYGLGAGSVDACLNNYVALHYESRHMSWLHCMWGVGAATGPYIIGYILAGGNPWNMGYQTIGIMQIILTAIIFISLPLWKKREQSKFAVDKSSTEKSIEADFDGTNKTEEPEAKPLSLKEIFAIPGAKEVMLAFFCYCALEQTSGLWASSYLVMHKGIAEEVAAGFASLFYIGITVGRALNGFLTIRFNDKTLIRMGEVIILIGVAVMFLPIGEMAALAGFLLIGLGCAPVYPCIIHSTPEHFGAENSQALIGVQMASAYVGICVMPPLFGLIANHISVALLPVYLFAILAVMFIMHESLCKKR